MPGLAEDPRLNDFPKYLDVIVREVYRCKTIIDSLLSFSRKSEGSYGRVNINTIVNEVLQLVRHQGRDKKIVLKENFLLPLPEVYGDASALRQVFLNLILNAFQAIDDEGVVSIETSANETHVSARVVDSGSGIAPEALEQIWNPFYTTKKVGRNQGLGLAISYDIVKKHEGTIMVNSKLGEGTVFNVRLPICQEK
jgi:signal transduction histidine kinase